MKAMLATDAKPARFRKVVLDGGWWMEPKYDGIRALVHVDDGLVSWSNRHGGSLTKPTPSSVELALGNMPGRFTIDGELIGGRLAAFDLPRLGHELEYTPHQERRHALEQVLRMVGCDDIFTTSMAIDTDEKEAMLTEALNDKWEGVMLKDRTGFYEFGRRSERILKMKFTRTVDCIVSATHRDAKTNANLSMVVEEGGVLHLRQVGACSLVGKEPVQVRDVVEVRFLYVSDEGHLVQPRLLRKRTDKLPEECTIDQLDDATSIKQPKGT